MKTYTFLICLLFPLIICAQQGVPGEIREFTKAGYLTKKKPGIAESRESLEERGDAYGRDQQWHKAAECYKKLVTLYPHVANYHYKYGGVLGMIALQNKFKAISIIGDVKKSFKKAAHLDPEHIAVRWALVELYAQLPGIMGGGLKKALHYADELQNLSEAEGFLAKAYIYESKNKYKEARKYNALVLTHLHEFKKVSKNLLHYRIGKLCSDQHTNLDEGLYHLQAYINHYTSQDMVKLYVVYYHIAKLYRQKNEKEKAMTWIRKALAADAGYKEALKEKELIEVL